MLANRGRRKALDNGGTTMAKAKKVEKKVTKKSKSLEVSKDDAVQLFKSCTYPTADTWPEAKLSEKLNKMDKMVKEDDPEPKDKKMKKLLAEVLEAVENGVTITVAGGKPAGKAGKAPPKAAKGGKGKQVEEEEEEDDDDDEEEDEDDDSEEEDEDESEDEDDSDDDDEDEDDEDDEEEVEEDDDSEDEEDEDEDESDDDEEEEEDEDDDDADDDSEDEEDEDEDESDEDEDEDSDDEDDEDDEDMEEATSKAKAKAGKKGGKVTAEKGGKATVKDKKGKKKGDSPIGKRTVGKNGMGVTESIVYFLAAEASKSKPLSMKAVLAKLVKNFKGVKEEGQLSSTLKTILPNRLRVEKGLDVKKDENGYWVDPKTNAKKLKELGVKVG
jgi:hypothetical protein